MPESSTSGDSSLLDELRADRPAPRGCAVCEFLAGRDDREEWNLAMADRTISHTAIFRAMQKRDFRFTEAPVGAHRRAGHEPH